MKKTEFDDDWKIWIWSNVARGCAKDGIFRILIDNDFDYGAIKKELNYEPSTVVDRIENPLGVVADDDKGKKSDMVLDRCVGADNRIPVAKRNYRRNQDASGVLLLRPGEPTVVRINQTALLIWQLCDGAHTTTEIVRLLEEEFPESNSGVIEQDVNAALIHLASCGVLEFQCKAGSYGPRSDGKERGQEPETQEIFLPKAYRVKTDSAEIYTVDNFLNTEEAQRLAGLIKKNLRPSTITNAEEPDKYFRTSRTCDLSALNDPFVAEIDARLCRYIGINANYAEKIQGQYYRVGEEFKPHTDYFESNELKRFGAVQGQRTWTFMVFLNDTQKGGATHFHGLNLSFEPRRGRAVIWSNLYSDGMPNPNTLHHGTAVEIGEKMIITKWFRERGEGPMYNKEINEYAPPLTPTGFKKMLMPRTLFEKLHRYYRDHAPEAAREVVKGGYINGPGKTASDLIELPGELKQQIHMELKSSIEQWCGLPLHPTYVYGIRRYNRGATLKPHRDRLETHIVSAILNIDQDVDADWPLEIYDHYYRSHQVTLFPGEMILYEGARLRHGRPTPLNGNSYANVFVHYEPRDTSVPSQ